MVKVEGWDVCRDHVCKWGNTRMFSNTLITRTNIKTVLFYMHVMYFELCILDQTHSHIINRHMIAGLLECRIITTEEGAKNTLIRWDNAVH